jgi:hypothetical protein
LSAAAIHSQGNADGKGRNIRRRLRKALLATLLVIVGAPIVSVGTLLVFWGVSFGDPAPQQDNCTFGSVTTTEYRRLLSEAKAQDWSVWPGLSNGLFWSSDRGWFGEQGAQTQEARQGQYLRRAIERLTFDHGSPDAQLAAAHALLRSMKADWVRVSEVPSGTSTDIEFTYYLQQRRFAPLCLHCLLWPFTTVDVHFIRTNSESLDRVIVLHGGLLYDPRKVDRDVHTCPAFPTHRNPGN